MVPLFYHRCVGLDGAAVLDMQHLTHMVQKYCDIATKCCKIRNCEKYMGCRGRFPNCICSIILHKVHFLVDTFNKLNVPFMNIVCIDVELM